MYMYSGLSFGLCIAVKKRLEALVSSVQYTENNEVLASLPATI